MERSLIDRIARPLFFRTLGQLSVGSIELVYRRESHFFGDPHSELRATIAVESDRFFRRAVFGGDVGLGESFMDGEWTSPDLVNVIRVAVRNLSVLERSGTLFSMLSRLANVWSHRHRTNTIDGSRSNISHHYDLGNDFYRLFLDPTMAYSCAYFSEPGQDLESAQTEKFDRICRKLDLQPGDRILEIGTGWGGFAIHAARNYGCHVTTTTISNRQYEYAVNWVNALDLGHRITLLKADYRTLEGQFDKIVSIEMFEAVGFRFYDEFFSRCNALLRPGGKMLLQTITMNETRFDDYLKSCDWTQKYIFPGAELASFSGVMKSLARCTNLSLTASEDIGMHYFHTLNAWRERFHRSKDRVRKLGFDERFLRMWDYYLAYCAGAFAERYISDVHLELTKDRLGLAVPVGLAMQRSAR